MHATDPRELDRSGRSLNSVNISWEILHVIADHSGATAAEIRNDLGYSKSTVHNHLQALVANRVLIRFTEHNPTCLGTPPEYPIYELSCKFLELGERTRRQFTPADIVDREVRRLSRRSGELAAFATAEYESIVFLSEERGPTGLDVGLVPGTRGSVPTTAFGRAILSQYADVDVRADRWQPELTPETGLTSLDDLEEAITTVRERGYAIDECGFRANARAVAAPVTIGDRVLGAFGLIGPASRFTAQAIGGLSSQVRAAAETVEIEADR